MPTMGWTDDEVYLVAERAYSLYQQGRFREAAIIFRGLTALDPGNIYCRTALAAVSLALGDAQRAVQELSAILAQYPNDADTRARRCEAYCQLRRWDEARKDLEFLQRRGDRTHSQRLAWRLEAGRAAIPGGV